MKTISAKAITIIVFLIVLLMALLPGCRGNAPSEPIRTQLSFSEPPILNKPVQLTATFSIQDWYNYDAHSVTARIILPEGIEKVEGDLELRGDFIRGNTYTLSAIVKSIKTGTWEVTAQAEFRPTEIEYYTNLADLWVSVSEKSASISDNPPYEVPTPTPTPFPTSTITEPFKIIALFPDGAPPLNQTAKLMCVIKFNFPPQSTYQPLEVNFKVNLPEAFELVSGELSWSGTVSPRGEINAIEAMVKSVKSGNWTIRVIHNVGDIKGYSDIYTLISDNSAEWSAVTPPWEKPTPSVTPGGVQ